MIQFKGSHFTKEIIMMSIRWYVAYPLSYRQIEELLAERGVDVDHATINRWVVKYAPLLEKKFRNIKKAPGRSWKMDETYIKVKGQWTYYYRAVDKAGDTIDFILSPTRDQAAAEAFFKKAIDGHGLPEKVNIDKSGANLAALKAINQKQENNNTISIRQIKYLNNQIEQDHRAIKRLTRPMLGFKNFLSAAATLAGIELHHMIKKCQGTVRTNLPIWEQFYLLAS